MYNKWVEVSDLLLQEVQYLCEMSDFVEPLII